MGSLPVAFDPALVGSGCLLSCLSCPCKPAVSEPTTAVARKSRRETVIPFPHRKSFTGERKAYHGRISQECETFNRQLPPPENRSRSDWAEEPDASIHEP